MNLNQSEVGMAEAMADWQRAELMQIGLSGAWGDG